MSEEAGRQSYLEALEIETISIIPYSVFVDIDKTLTTNHVLQYALQFAERRGLSFGKDELRDINSGVYTSSKDIPTLQAFQKQNSTGYQSTREEIGADVPLHAQGLKRREDALSGVWRMYRASEDFAGFYTVRPAQVRSATIYWLGHDHSGALNSRDAEFPNHTQVIVCDSPVHKLMKILAYKNPNSTKLSKLLIDDSLDKLTEAAQTIHIEHPDLREELARLTLVGFGVDTGTAQRKANTLTEQTGVRIYGLPTWKQADVNLLLGVLQKQ